MRLPRGRETRRYVCTWWRRTPPATMSALTEEWSRAVGAMSFIGRAALLALFVSGVAALVALEAVERIVDPFGISYYPETARFFDRMILEEPIGYRLPPGMHERFWGTTVSVNSTRLECVT